jgi:hypothetical protein
LKLADVGNFNGYSNRFSAYNLPSYVAGTKEALFATGNISDENIANIAGFNFQVGAVGDSQYYVITSIVLVKKYVSLDLTDANIVAAGGSGSGSTDAEASENGLKFAAGANMMYVNFSNYLTSKGLNISDYAGISVTYQLKNSTDDGNAESANETSTYGKIAPADVSKLNGSDSGYNPYYLSNFVTGTQDAVFATGNISDENIANIAGFNFQVEKTASDQYYVITDIKLISK